MGRRSTATQTMPDDCWKRCGDCIHENACQSWAMGSLKNANAAHCVNYESLRGSSAYFIGYREGVAYMRKKANNNV